MNAFTRCARQPEPAVGVFTAPTARRTHPEQRIAPLCEKHAKEMGPWTYSRYWTSRYEQNGSRFDR